MYMYGSRVNMIFMDWQYNAINDQIPKQHHLLAPSIMDKYKEFLFDDIVFITYCKRAK